MKPVIVKSSTYIDSNKENNEEDPKFEVSDLVRISKYKNISADYFTFQIGVKKFLSLKKLKILVTDMLLMILTVKNVLERFTKKNCKKQTKNNLESNK